MGHWYTKEGEPMHWVLNKSKPGETRPTTLRDAKKLDLVPSVTEILKVADKPALTRWKVEQAYLAAMTLPPIEGESLDDFIRRAKADAEQQTKDAVDIGVEMHAAVEAYYKGESVPTKYADLVLEVSALLEQLTELERTDWISEHTFATDTYGGMVDLHTKRDDGIVVDFKSKDFGPDAKRLHWDEQDMQLSAYARGLGIPHARRINVYMSRNNLGLVAHHEWDQEDDRAWMKFECLRDYWRLEKL